jgi:hypothetical protein
MGQVAADPVTAISVPVVFCVRSSASGMGTTHGFGRRSPVTGRIADCARVSMAGSRPAGAALAAVIASGSADVPGVTATAAQDTPLAGRRAALAGSVNGSSTTA